MLFFLALRYFCLGLACSSFNFFKTSYSSLSFFSTVLSLYLILPFSSSPLFTLSLIPLISPSFCSIVSLSSLICKKSSCYSLWYLSMLSFSPCSFRYLSLSLMLTYLSISEFKFSSSTSSCLIVRPNSPLTCSTDTFKCSSCLLYRSINSILFLYRSSSFNSNLLSKSWTLKSNY